MENIRVIYSRIAIYLFLSINTFFEQISNEDDRRTYLSQTVEFERENLKFRKIGF